MASFTVAAGTTVTARQDMSGADVGTIEAAVLVPPTAAGVLSVSANAQAIRFTGATNGAIINNSGTIEVTGAQAEPRAIRFENAVGATLNASINNLVSTSIIQSIDDAIQIQAGVVTAGTVTVNNTGVISSNVGQAIDFAGGTGTFVTDVFNNSGGVVRALVSDAIRIGGVGDIVNFGAIDGGSAAANTEGADGVQFEDNTSGTVSNFENGFWPSISGDRHGINAGTGSNITVNNGAPVPVPGFWSITGRNGSGIGSDGDATVTNFGIITGSFTAGLDINSPGGGPDGTDDGDGDGIDIDGEATIVNNGTIEGTGASGHGSDGLPNTSEGIAAGGGTIGNNAGGIIRGVGLGILIDDSSQGNAPFSTFITNQVGALIEGTNSFGIRIISNQGDIIVNDGTITGNGTAIQFGDGNDLLFIGTSSVINGNSDGGNGSNLLSYSSYGGGGVTVDLSTNTATGTGGVSNFQRVTGSDNADVITGNGVANTLLGGAGIDGLNGGGEADTLNGGTDADAMNGGTGNDTYFVDNAGDAITEAAGDTLDRLHASTTYVLAAAAAVELITTTNSLATTAIDLTGSDTANSIYGNAGDNTLKGAGDNDVLLGVAGDDNLNGGAGDDKLYGGAGQNDMAGGTGSDWYIVDSASDVIVEAAGDALDRMTVSVDYTLAAGVSVELMITTQVAGAVDLTGNEFANHIRGNDSANTLGGAGGNDVLVGFGGTDTLNGGADADTLYGGNDADTLNGDGEADKLYGEAGDDNLNGGAGVDRLEGGAGQNDMAGGTGDDVYIVTSTTDTVTEGAGQGTVDRVYSSVNFTLAAGVQVEFLATTNITGIGALNLTGNEFANAIYGNEGANELSGKGGKDTLSGRGGPDLFVFDTVPDTATNFDFVTDFNGAQDDIRLVKSAFTALTGAAGTTLSADQFVVGEVALDATDRIIYHNGTLNYDSNGNLAGGVQVIAFVLGKPALSNTDIVLG